MWNIMLTNNTDCCSDTVMKQTI